MGQELSNNSEYFQLDGKYSTTRRVFKSEPIIVNNTDDKVKSMLFMPDNPDRVAEGGLRTQGYFKQNDPVKPLISIITVVFNGVEHLEQTILSVIDQNYDNVEYIIIDGGSNDGTLDVVRKYEGQIDYWVSEPDKGIADAFNKGILLCTGEVIGIINADDWYEEECFDFICKHIKGYEVVYGDMRLIDSEGAACRPVIDHNKLKIDMTLCHPSVFVKKSAYKSYGIYDENFLYAMDYDLLLGLYLKNVDFSYCKKTFASMRLSGVSDKMWVQALKEVKKSKLQKGISRIQAEYLFYFFYLKRSMRYFFQSIGLSFLVNFYRKIVAS